MRIATLLLAVGCGGVDAPPVTLDRGLDFDTFTENPFTSEEMVLEAQDASFALGGSFPDHFGLIRTNPRGGSCELGTVIWTDVTVDDDDILEIEADGIGALVVRLLDTGNTDVELIGRFRRGSDGNCISGLPDEIGVRSEVRVRVFEPTRMVVDRSCFEDQDPLRVATRSWLPLEALAIESTQGDRFRPVNAGAGGAAPFPVEVRTTAGEALAVEPARDDAFSSLPGIRAPVVGANDVVVEGPNDYSVQWDVVGPDDVDLELSFTYLGAGETFVVTDGQSLDPRIETGGAWVIPTPGTATVGLDPLCGPVDPVWFSMSTSDEELCPVERWPRLEDVPEAVRAVTEDVLTAARLVEEGPCELSVFPPGVSIAFDVEEP
ncbi:MAG: hypothetical protein AAF211_03750 [Myxococcota bacterium]